MKEKIKTFLLLALLSIIIIVLGYVIGSYNGLIIAFFVMLAFNFLSYFYSANLILSLYRAKPSKIEWLNEMVTKLAKKAGIPTPKTYIADLNIANAFATGRNPKNSAVVVTRGMLEKLNREEIKGVLAHEISHIKNYDILIGSIAAVLAGVITFVAYMLRFSLFFSDREDIFSLLGLLAFSILAPIAALLIQLAISRSREFLADASGARLLKDGKPLAEALIKLENQKKVKLPENTAHLFIINPLRKSTIASLFSTHPPTEERVKRLLSMKF